MFHQCSILFNKTCLNINLLPKYTLCNIYQRLRPKVTNTCFAIWHSIYIDQNERRYHGSREMVKLINSDPAVLDALVTFDESWIYCYDPETKRQSSQLKHAGSPRPKKAWQSKSPHKLLMILVFLYSTGTIYMHWVSTELIDNKEYYVEVLRDFRKRFGRKRPALFKSGQWHFHQNNTRVHNSILVTDYLTKIGIKTDPHRHYSADLDPCDFWLFPKLKEKLRDCR